MLVKLKHIWTQSADFLLPPRCPLCDIRTGEHYTLCGTCFGKLAFVADPLCSSCGVPFDFKATNDDQVCGDCLASPPPFDWAGSALLYNDASRPAILRLKHGEALEMAPWLATMIGRVLAAGGHDWDVIVPVPLHRRRLWRRGFNQSAEISRHLGHRIGASFEPGLLLRRRNTPSQGGLSRKARFRNLAGAFELAPDAKARLEGRRVLLVDDVLTTGATVQACARKLRRAGPAMIGVATAARVSHTFASNPQELFTDL